MHCSVRSAGSCSRVKIIWSGEWQRGSKSLRLTVGTGGWVACSHPGDGSRLLADCCARSLGACAAAHGEQAFQRCADIFIAVPADTPLPGRGRNGEACAQV